MVSLRVIGKYTSFGIARTQKSEVWRTMHHVGGSYARELRAIVDDTFALADERVKEDKPVVIDQ